MVSLPDFDRGDQLWVGTQLVVCRKGCVYPGGGLANHLGVLDDLQYFQLASIPVLCSTQDIPFATLFNVGFSDFKTVLGLFDYGKPVQGGMSVRETGGKEAARGCLATADATAELMQGGEAK